MHIEKKKGFYFRATCPFNTSVVHVPFNSHLIKLENLVWWGVQQNIEGAKG